MRVGVQRLRESDERAEPAPGGVDSAGLVVDELLEARTHLVVLDHRPQLVFHPQQNTQQLV